MQTLHYNYFLKKAPILKHKPPNEIYCYSNIPPLIEFTHRALTEFTIPENLKPGENYSIDTEKQWNVKDGVCNFKRYIFPKNESRIKNFLLDVASYEICHSKNFEKSKDINNTDNSLATELKKLSLGDDKKISNLKRKPKILCHNGLHNDIARGSKETYDLIYYQDQMIFSSQDRRTNQNNLVSYIGLKFEDLLCKVDKTDGRTHFKSLIEGNYGKWSYWSVVEIDALRKQPVEANEKKIEKNVRFHDRYTEIKLRLIKGNNKHQFKSIKSAKEFLLYLKNSSRSSSFTIEKWVYQCYFGMSPYLVVGVRDDSFNVLAVQEIDVKKDLIPFYRKHFGSSYKKFIRSVDKLDTVYDFIENFVKQNLEGKNVFQFAIKGSDEFEIEKITGQLEEEIFKNVLQPEFEEWRETGKDTIAASPLIRHTHPVDN